MPERRANGKNKKNSEYSISRYNFVVDVIGNETKEWLVKDAG
jgi:hypothetical protein